MPQLAAPACRTPTTPCTPEQRFLQLQLTQDGKPCQPQQAHYGAWSRLHRCCHREQLFRHQQAAAATAAAAGGETTATTAAHDCVGCALPDELGHAAALSSKGSSEGRAGRTFAHRVLAQGCGKLAGQIASTLTSERALAAWGAAAACGAMLWVHQRRLRPARPLLPPRPASLEQHSRAAECKLGASPPSLPRLKKQKRDSSHQKKKRPHSSSPRGARLGRRHASGGAQ